MEPTNHAVPRRPRRRVITSLLVAVFVLAVPALVLANHQYSDVPTASTFHDDIENLTGAAITTGCGGGNYCPSNPVTRAQMAGFLNRGLGSSTAGEGFLPVSEAATTYIATVDLRPGAVSGGTAYVSVSGDVSLIDTVGGCPCLAFIGLQHIDSLETSPPMLFMVGSETVDGGTAQSGSVSWVFEVPSGVEGTFGLFADVFTPEPAPLSTDGVGTEEPFLIGTMVAQYTPFGTVPEPAPVSTELPARWADRISTELRELPQQ